ncbi:MAG: Lrp/AsnC ligand binding domain-containing protein [Thaumarchaeota archaeon]|nr:Lrp/AsnC ligand binding domain-containing protein [Nitrososphaerota archaeon]
MSKKAGIRAILHIFVESSQLENVSREITKLPESLDVYEVTGEFDIVAIVTANSIDHFREFLKDKILKIPGVKSTVTSIVLHTYKKDGVETGE